MNSTPGNPLLDWLNEWVAGWNRFWFRPRDAATLGLIRILAGAVLVYTHAVWTFELDSFLGLHGILDLQYSSEVNEHSGFVWSHFSWIDHPVWLWGTHVVALAVMLAFTVGLWTRITAILSAFFAISYAHRAGGTLFGLDQINGLLVLYLAISPCGALYSLDSRWRPAGQGGRRGRRNGGKTVMANIATRLIQLHLCVVYLFAGMGKLAGAAWWDGTAIWGAIASHEYQTVDLTFLSHWPLFLNLVTLTTLAWECSYPFLIWPRLTRPVWLAMAVVVHLGIGLCMGMMTFGIIMVVANLAFIEPEQTRQLVDRCRRRAPARVV